MADLDKDGTIFVGKGSKPEVLTLAFANRHGLITGATGTGKTVTLQVLAEGLSRAGVLPRSAKAKNPLWPEPKVLVSNMSPTSSRWCSGTWLGRRGTPSARRFPR